MSNWLIILLTAVATLLLSAIVRAFTPREKKVNYQIEHLFSVSDEQFLRSMSSLLPPGYTSNNRITPLLNGDAFFPEMLDAIRGATHTITFETFIYWRGDIGKQFAKALADRRKAGVKVHVLLDWLGANKIDPDWIAEMERAGIEVERYHPVRWYHLRRANNRTHRKLLVIDGRLGFTGGAGIADEWSGNAQDPSHWRDTHFKLEGPVVAQCQAAFMDNWLKVRSRVLHADTYYPKLDSVGDTRAMMFISSPAEGGESARLMYLFSIASAASSVRIATAYFVPDDLSVQTIVDACKRGVRVQILVPGKYSDTQITRRAGRSRWGPLLQGGAEIYEYQPTMFHCKVMVVDEVWTSVGSANFDNRSFRLNDEANLNIHDAAFGQDQSQAFEQDLTRSRRITYEEWKNRPLTEKLKEHAAGLLRSQL